MVSGWALVCTATRLALPRAAEGPGDVDQVAGAADHAEVQAGGGPGLVLFSVKLGTVSTPGAAAADGHGPAVVDHQRAGKMDGVEGAAVDGRRARVLGRHARRLMVPLPTLVRLPVPFW